MRTCNRIYLSRQQIKTSEGEFIYELLNSYELSPKVSEQILLSAKQHLLRENILKEGQIEVTVVGIEERAGKTIENMFKKKVVLTIDSGMEDIEALKEFGRIGLRQIRIQRISEEAKDQEGILSQEDIAKYLSCDVRTVRRDIQQIKGREIEVITRGVLHNIGRGQTHKKKIIGLYLEGYFFGEIKNRTRHSVGAIKRYIQDFTKVLMSIHKGIKENEDIRSVTGISVNLIKQYKEILRESRGNKRREEKLQFIIQMRKEPLKKTTRIIGNRAVHTIGGYRWA
jgi:hypothetical protein